MNSESLLDLNGLQVYHFEKKTPTALKGQYWKMTECKHGAAIIINKDSSVQVHIRKQVVIITYENAKAYFSKLQNGYASLHFSKENQNVDLFEYKLQENDIQLVEWDKARATVKKQIQKECGSKINEQKNTSVGSVQKVGLTVGKLFGSINKMVKGVPEKVTKSVNQKYEETKEKHVDEETKGKWSSFKNKMSSMNKSISETFKPASDKISEVTSDVGQKFENSDNKVVKGVRDFGNKVKTSLNKGFGEGERGQNKEQKVEMKMAEKEEEPKVESERAMN